MDLVLSSQLYLLHSYHVVLELYYSTKEAD